MYSVWRSKIVHLYSMRAYKGAVGKAPRILTVLDDGECWAVRPQPPYPRGKEPHPPIRNRAEWALETGWMFRGRLPLPEIELQILCVVQHVAWSLYGPPRPSRSFVWRPLIGTHWVILVSDDGFCLSCCWEISCNIQVLSVGRYLE